MHENGRPQQLMMLRHAQSVPECALAQGWSIRSMREHEEAEWVRICRAVGFIADDGGDAEQCWNQTMGSDPGVSKENVFFVCNDSGRPVATATARRIPEGERGNYPPAAGSLGYLHYVAALPECRGKGAGSAVTAAVLRRLANLGLDECVLTTDDNRLAAIAIYLKLGWLPVLHQPDMRARWERVLGGLGVKGSTGAVAAGGGPAEPLSAAADASLPNNNTA